MKKSNSTLKSFALAVGLVVCTLIVLEGFSKKDSALVVASTGSYDSIGERVSSKKSLIVNSYLIGLSIYKLKENLDQ